MSPQNDSAVSPVVGVMLMLVVVIIIAAIVSGFAGSLVSSNNKAPQATIQGTYSASAGILRMYHAGGDELSTAKIFVLIRLKDEDWGGFQGAMAKPMTNKSFICNAAGVCWVDANGLMSDTGKNQTAVSVWRPGETMFYNQSISNLDITKDIGKSLILEIDTTDGKLISKSDVKVGL
jgi:archaeal type IV pilus assembly protein PilA